MLGILLFYPLFKDLADSKVMVVRWVGQITLVSFAAQLFTFPISTYYFHQFPTYFWLVNPVVIGLTPVLMYGTLAVLSVSWLGWAPLTSLLAYVTDGAAQGMNAIVELPRLLPGYLAEDLHFDLTEVGLILVILLMFYALVKGRNHTYLKPLALMCLLFFTYAMARSLDHATSSRVLFHAVPKHTVLSLTDGQNAYIFSDTAFKTDTLAYNFHLKNYLIAQGIQKVSYYALPDKNNTQPLRLNLPQLPVYVDARVPSNEKKWVILRRRRFPGIDTFTQDPHSHFMVSPELGFKTKAQWVKLLQQSGNQVTDPMKLGAVGVP